MGYNKKILTAQYVIKAVIFFFLIILLFGCKKIEPKRIVKVETISITDIGYTSCTAQGSIIDIGEDGITQHGFCWSTSQNPTLADNKKELGPRNSTGVYSDILTGLSPNTTYYIKAFARSHDEEFYGDQESFVTLAPREPTVITTAVHNITENSAQCGAEVIDDGGVKLIMRGVCWSTITGPTIADSHTENGDEIGLFVGDLTGLDPGTTYYVRAYATNSIGTSYGEELSFDTEWPQSGTFNDPRDGNEYPWIKMGEQIWMGVNLAYLPEVSSGTTSTTIPIYYVYDYNGTNVAEAKASDNYKTYGVLYNWPAAIEACPDGWHLPSDDEWKHLEMFLGMSQEDADNTGFRGTDIGSQMSRYSFLWDDGALENDPAFGSSEFVALPGGYLSYVYAQFRTIGSDGNWWSMTDFDTNNAWRRSINYDNSGVQRDYTYKANGFSVRCVRD
ncbi:MAG: fibrobacter succinogenes major paralogous domain-containing protein [Bacteroidales bacterium]|nr:fibrobacter succinogenes major paralogous domain-containing protein [Bacteroidales bacterium]